MARSDHPSAARSPSSLTADERARFAELIERPQSYPNLVLMCSEHHDVIDSPKEGYSVAAVVEMKRAHEDTVRRDRQERRARRAAPRGDPRPPTPAPTVLILDDVATWQRKAVRRLAEREPESWTWLGEQVGDPPEFDRVNDLVGRWPPQLADASDDVLAAVARIAEGRAAWHAASTVWERAGWRAEGAPRADDLVRAAIDAGVGGDHTRREYLLDAAERADPNCTRLRLERLDDYAPPHEQLDQLAEIATDDAPLAALVSASRARAAMLIPDMEQAERHLAEARELDGDSIQVRCMDVNLRVQRARVAVRDDQSFVLTEVKSSQEDALGLRDEMVEMQRWEESASLLMLAADASVVLRDPGGAEALLRRARAEEVEAANRSHVLGDAALRAGAPDLALEFVANAVQSDATRRIRASARVELPGSQRIEALDELRELALAGGPESDLAAAARLGACVSSAGASWDEDVAAVLEGGYHARVARGLRILSLAARGDHQAAERLASDLPAEAWASEVQLRVAGARGNRPRTREAAERFLAFAPDPSGQLLAGTALAQAGALERAGQVLGALAHDVNAPPVVRSDAFHALLSTLADRDDWLAASREWRGWQDLSRRDLRRPDSRLSAWQVRVAHNATRRP